MMLGDEWFLQDDTYPRVDIDYDILYPDCEVYLGMSLHELRQYFSLKYRGTGMGYEDYIAGKTITYYGNKVTITSIFNFKNNQLVEVISRFDGDTTLASTYFRKSRYVNHNSKTLNGFIYKDNLVEIYGHNTHYNSKFHWVYTRISEVHPAYSNTE